MHAGHKAVTGFLAVLLALLLLITGLMARWPLWAWPVAVGVVAAYVAVSLVSARRNRPAIPPEHLREPDLPIAPAERWECTVKDIALPTRHQDYDVRFSATVRWLPQEHSASTPVVNAGGLAVDAVLERARRITQQSSPQRSSLVQHQLNGELATMLPDATGRVLAMAENVRLALEETDRERLQRLATVRKDESVWEHERKWEQSKRAYLGEDVLKSPGSAVVWWLSRNDDQIHKTVSDIGLLAELASAAHDQAVPPDFHRFVPGLAQAHDVPINGEPVERPQSPDDYVELVLRSSGLPEDDPRRTLYLKRMADAAQGADLHDLADALLRRLDVAPDSPDAPHEDEPPDYSADTGFDD